MTNDQILKLLPEKIGALFTISNSLWMTSPLLRREIERRGFFATNVTPTEVTLRRDLYGLRDR